MGQTISDHDIDELRNYLAGIAKKKGYRKTAGLLQSLSDFGHGNKGCVWPIRAARILRSDLEHLVDNGLSPELAMKTILAPAKGLDNEQGFG